MDENQILIEGIFLSEIYSFNQNLIYANIGNTDQSSDFTPSSSVTITHNSDDYSLTSTSAGYGFVPISKLTGTSLNNCTLEFDVYISSASVDFGFGFDVTKTNSSGSSHAFVGLNDYRRITYHPWNASSDSYYNINDSSLTGWLHFKYTIANNLLLLQIYKDNTFKYSKDVSLPSSNLGTNTIYRLSVFWKTGERKLKNLIVRSL